MMVAPPPLWILVVEDEMTIAMMLEDMIEDLGHRVYGTAARLEPALAMAASGDFDFAILDINLDGLLSFPVAELLREREIPFIFATGYGARGLSAEFAEVPVLTKPFLAGDLHQLMEEALPERG